MSEFHHARLRLALEYLGWTTKDYSARAGIGATTAYRILNGKTPFTEQRAEEARFVTGFPLTFFMLTDKEPPAAALTFRAKRDLSAKIKGKVTGEFAMLAATVEKLRGMTGFAPQAEWAAALAPSSRPSSADIERIAVDVRRVLCVKDDEPVNNVMRAFERGGIPSVPLTSGDASMTHEGVTCPAEPFCTPVIGYFHNDASGDRLRYTIAHEGGHLVLQHFRMEDDDRLMEREAHRFAGAFLLPEHLARAVLTPRMELHDFVEVKAAYGVSIAALIMRATQLGIIDNDRKRSLMMQLSARGWRRREPVHVERETPLLFRQMLGCAFGTLETPTRAIVSKTAAEGFLGIPANMLDAWADGVEFKTDWA